MKRLIKVLSLTLIMAILLTMSAMVNAQSVSMNLTCGAELEEGSTVEVKVNIGAVDAGDGIDTITASLSYDKKVFETISTTDITSTTGWIPSYADSTGKITIQKSTKTTAAETVVVIKLRVKSELSTNSTTVSLTGIQVSGGRVEDGGTGDINVSNASVTIKKPGTAEEDTPSVVKPIEAKSSDSTKAGSSKLPQTGVNDNVVIAMAVVAAIGAVSFVRYTIVKKDIK